VVLNFRKLNRIKVENVELPLDMIECDVDSKDKLETIRHGQILIETPNDFYLVSSKGNMAFHYSKPGPPKIMAVEKLELNPDSFSYKVELSQKTLFDFAKKEGLFIFETDEGYYLPSSELVFFSKKGKSVLLVGWLVGVKFYPKPKTQNAKARAIDRLIYQYHVITWKNQRKRQIEAAKRAWNAIGFYGLPL
jgi:hypothetical protein